MMTIGKLLKVMLNAHCADYWLLPSYGPMGYGMATKRFYPTIVEYIDYCLLAFLMTIDLYTIVCGLFQ